MPHHLFSPRFLRSLSAALLLLFIAACPPPAFAEEEEKDSTLPDGVEAALTTLLKLPSSGAAVPEDAVGALLEFVAGAGQSGEKVLPARREHGTSAFMRETLNVPLRDVIRYLADPRLPGAALYPTAVRRNAWLPGSQILSGWRAMTESPLPPAKPVVLRGTEEEETTPDTSSGCTYLYTLKRLFILTSINGRSALISVSVMPKASGYGTKGVLVSDRDWRYLYTTAVGTNLPMLGWTKTVLYGSASVIVYMEKAPHAKSTAVSVFKWTKAGWSGMNAVKTRHIEDGIKRFAAGLRQLLESPRRPEPDALAAQTARLATLDDAALRALITPFADGLKRSGNKTLGKSPYKELLDTGYAASLSREGALAEAVKIFLRDTLQP